MLLRHCIRDVFWDKLLNQGADSLGQSYYMSSVLSSQHSDHLHNLQPTNPKPRILNP